MSAILFLKLRMLKIGEWLEEYGSKQVKLFNI